MNLKFKFYALPILLFAMLSSPGQSLAKDGIKIPRVVTNSEQRLKVYLTGYSYWDNTPPGSSAISHPVIHKRAGGNGSYRNPITLAVGHAIIGGRDRLDFSAGTRFYFPRLRKYAIVEDSCGDGARPQNGPCHTGYRGKPWVDIYVDGAKYPKALSKQCFNRLTGIQIAIISPNRNYRVVKGSLTGSGCKIY